MLGEGACEDKGGLKSGAGLVCSVRACSSGLEVAAGEGEREVCGKCEEGRAVWRYEGGGGGFVSCWEPYSTV